MMYKFFTYVLVFVLIMFIDSKPQSFGFGCLGLVGGYAGYSYQEYKPTGLNNYIQVFNNSKSDSLKGPLQNFGKATGFRVGINFFRANVRGFLLTAKGYYQQLNEKTNATVSDNRGSSNTTINLKFKTLAVGFDLGTSITNSLGWKIIDAAVNFNNANLDITLDHPNGHTSVNQYNTEKTIIGYSIGSGFILNVIDQYLTLEGTAAYSFLNINKMKTAEVYLMENESSTVPMNNFIQAGGFNAVIQLNIGLPL